MKGRIDPPAQLIDVTGEVRDFAGTAWVSVDLLNSISQAYPGLPTRQIGGQLVVSAINSLGGIDRIIRAAKHGIYTATVQGRVCDYRLLVKVEARPHPFCIMITAAEASQQEKH